MEPPLLHHLRGALAEANSLARCLQRQGIDAALLAIASDQAEEQGPNWWRCQKVELNADSAIIQAGQYIHDQECGEEEPARFISLLVGSLDYFVLRLQCIHGFGSGLVNGDFFAGQKLAVEVSNRLLSIVDEAEDFLVPHVDSTSEAEHPTPNWSAPMSKAEIVRRWYDRHETHPERFIDEILRDVKHRSTSERRLQIDLNAVPPSCLSRLTAPKNWQPSD